MSADKNPLEDAVEQALDAFVYAPIGLMFDGPATFPKLVKNGRNQVTTARMMGQFAVQAGRAEVEKRAKQVDGPLGEVLRSLGLVPPAQKPPKSGTAKTDTGSTDAESTPAAEKAPAKKSGTRKAAAKKSGAKKSPVKKSRAAKKSTKKSAGKRTAKKASTARRSAPAADSLAIPDYDSLSASQVVSRVRGLDDAQLAAVEAYESANRGRKTVLSKIAQLRDA